MGRINRLHGVRRRTRNRYGRVEHSRGPVFLRKGQVEKLETSTLAFKFAVECICAEFAVVLAYSPHAESEAGWGWGRDEVEEEFERGGG